MTEHDRRWNPAAARQSGRRQGAEGGPSAEGTWARAYGGALAVAGACLGLASLAVVWGDWAHLGAVSLLKVVELGLFGFLVLTWLAGAGDRWRRWREENGAGSAGAGEDGAFEMGARLLLPAVLLVGFYAALAWMLLSTPGFVPQSSLVALAMVVLLGVGRWVYPDDPRP